MDDSFEVPESKLMELSKQVKTDVIWLAFQGVVDGFQFYHWRSGAHLRTIVYGCFVEERTWEQVEGDPEPWEGEVFFDPKELASALRHELDESKRTELERIWQAQEILPGRHEPGLDSRACAHHIARYYGLPHYG